MIFKVGDRVVFYNDGSRSIGIIENTDAGGRFWIESDDYARLVIVFPQQCRKLVKKKRRHLWINPKLVDKSMIDSISSAEVSETNMTRFGWIEFIEVVGKKK